jgi:hypothetical protein
LCGFTRLPLIDDQGNIRCWAGYDPTTGLYNDKPIHLDIPDQVTKDDALRLKNVLFKPFSEYKFKDQEAGVATTLALIFTALQRAQMALAPMFGIRSPQSGTGKGKLYEAVMALVINGIHPNLLWGPNITEFEKRLEAALMQTPSIISVDNANGVLVRSQTLESVITDGFVAVRVLGFSKLVDVYCRPLIILNGNAFSISGDMARRAPVIDIELGSDEPEHKKYPFDPVEYTRQHRKELLEAAYAIMRAYRQAKMPQGDLPAVASLVPWSRKVRDLVHWITNYDVAKVFSKNKDEDPLRQNDTALLAALYNLHFDKDHKPGPTCSRDFTSADVITVYNNVKQHADAEPVKIATYNALNEVFHDRKVESKALGIWAGQKAGAYLGGFKLNKTFDKHTKVNSFTVTCTDEAYVNETVENTKAKAAEQPSIEKAKVDVEKAWKGYLTAKQVLAEAERRAEAEPANIEHVCNKLPENDLPEPMPSAFEAMGAK